MEFSKALPTYKSFDSDLLCGNGQTKLYLLLEKLPEQTTVLTFSGVLFAYLTPL